MICRLCILLVAVLLAMPSGARLTFTQKLQKKATVRLMQDKELDLLVNGREADIVGNESYTTSPTKTQTNTAPQQTKTTATTIGSNLTQPKSNTQQTKPVTPQTPTHNQHQPQTSTPTSTAVHPAVVKRATTKYTTAVGYRVKIYMGGSTRQDRETAQNVGKEFKNLFPGTSVYMHFVSPHWICTAGDFLSQSEATAFIKKIKETSRFNTVGMTVVKSKVKVPVK